MQATVADKIGKILPRLASDIDGEVVATARAIGRVLSAAKLDWHDLAAELTAPPAASAKPQPKPRPKPKARTRPAPPPPKPPKPDLVQFEATPAAVAFMHVMQDKISDNGRQFLMSMLRRAEFKETLRMTERQARWAAELARDHGVDWTEGLDWLKAYEAAQDA